MQTRAVYWKTRVCTGRVLNQAANSVGTLINSRNPTCKKKQVGTSEPAFVQKNPRWLVEEIVRISRDLPCVDRMRMMRVASDRRIAAGRGGRVLRCEPSWWSSPKYSAICERRFRRARSGTGAAPDPPIFSFPRASGLLAHASHPESRSRIGQLLRRNVKRFRGGLVFKAQHRPPTRRFDENHGALLRRKFPINAFLRYAGCLVIKHAPGLAHRWPAVQTLSPRFA